MSDIRTWVIRHAAIDGAPGGNGRALALRAVHTLVAVVELGSLGYLWECAVTRRRDQRLRVAVAILAAEGVGLAVGRGDCPLRLLRRRWGDPVPLFELVLPPRAAKAAVPVLAAVTVAGLATLLARSPASAGPKVCTMRILRPWQCRKPPRPTRIAGLQPIT